MSVHAPGAEAGTGGPTAGVDYVEIGIRDRERSLDFYQGVLGFPRVEPPTPSRRGITWLDAGSSSLAGASTLLALAETDEDGGASPALGWRPDDLQKGFRHIGFKVGDVAAYAERLRDAGTTFTLEPLEAVGGVHLAFFTDPDGTLLEIIDGHLHYDRVWSGERVRQEETAASSRSPGAGPVFDHVAVTVEDLDAALRLYRDELGYELIGGLDHAFYDERGFQIDYLQAGPSILELFTFTAADKEASPWTADPRTPGIRGLGLAVPRLHHALDPHELLRPSGQAPAVQEAVGLIDPDGIALQVRRIGG
jgi:catechol 2,3-dioxygenase-like lactoylglutathione lyase family enzyme